MKNLPARRTRNSRSFYDSTVRPPLRLIAGFAFVLLIGLAGVGIYWFTALPVTVTINGQPTVVRTHQTTVDGLLHEIGSSLSASDTITPPGQTPIHSGLNVIIQTARPVVIDVDGQPRQLLVQVADVPTILKAAGVTVGNHDRLIMNSASDLSITRAQPIQIQDGTQPVQSVQTTAQTVSGALAEAGIALYNADLVTPPLDTLIMAGMSISIVRSRAITVQVDGQTLNTRTTGKTVNEALTLLGIGLIGQDRSTPALDQPITPNLAIKVIRVTETEESSQIAIPFTIIQQSEDGLLPGQQRIVMPGVPGIAQIYMLARREDGVLVSRSAPLRFVIQPPQAQIVAVSPADLPTPTVVPSGTPGQ